MHRSCTAGFLATVICFTGVAHAFGQAACRPALAVRDVHFSPMLPPTMERKWTATVAVDASRCAVNSAGHFEIVFIRLKEIGPDLEFRERFAWQAPAVNIAVDFWADEAVERYRIANITSCPCAD